MVTFIPVIHAFDITLGLVNGKHRAFINNLKISIGNNSGNFDDPVTFRDQARHFQVNPDEMLLFIHYLFNAGR